MTYDENEKQNLIRVVVCRPGERAEATWIEENLRSMQAAVGGLIQEFKPFRSESDPRYDIVALICNEEGKLMNLEPSRLIKDENGSGRYDAIALHLDSDFAGKSADRSITDQLGNRYVIRDEPPPVGKDCNDYLMHIRYQNRSKRMGSPGHEPAR